MSKKIKSAIIGGAVLLVLIAAVLVLVFMPQSTDDDTATSSNDLIKIIEEDYKTVKSVEVTNKLGSYTIEKTGDGEWGIPDLKGLNEVGGYSNMMSSISSSYATSIVAEDCDNLSLYGLASPQMKMTVTYENGNVYKLEIGDMPNASTAYTKLEGDKTVYQLAKTKFDQFNKTALDFLDKTVIATPNTVAAATATGQTVAADVTSVSITRADLEYPLQFRQYSDEELESGTIVGVNLRMSAPVVADLREQGTTTYLLNNFGITASEVAVIHPTDEQKTEYGFDEPSSVYEVTYNDTSDENSEETVSKSARIVTGNGIQCSHEEGEDLSGHTHGIEDYYVMVDGNDVIFVVPAESMLWLTVQAKDVISPIVAITPILNMYSVDLTFDGANYKIDYARDEEDPEDVNAFVATVNGKEVDLEMAKKLLQILYIPYATDIVTEGYDGTPDLSFTYNLTNGGTTTVDIYVTDDRTTIIAVDGVKLFKGRAGFVEKVKKELNNLLNGNTVIVDW